MARQYGFHGGLVPGVTVYAYLTHPLVDTFGPAWLERGTASVKFVKPLFEGEEVLVSGQVDESDAATVTVTLTASTAARGACGVGTATLPSAKPDPVDARAYQAASLPPDRPEATREVLASRSDGPRVSGGSLRRRLRRRLRGEGVGGLPVYRGAGGLVQPGFLLHLANQALSQNVRLGPWIHTGSVVRNLRAGQIGEVLSARGRVRALTEKKGRESVELDLLLLGGDRPITHVYHSAIYRLPAPASS